MKEITSDYRIFDYTPEGINGTSLQGEVTCTYSVLKKVFGHPTEGDGYKIQAEWFVKTPAGMATIYDYKQGKQYDNQKDYTPKTKVTEWHIGGKTEKVVPWIIWAITNTQI